MERVPAWQSLVKVAGQVVCLAFAQVLWAEQ